MIVERVTHLDQLAHKLQEPRVRRVIEPMLAGLTPGEVAEDDRQYLVDLGLLRRDGAGGLIVANPIYREVLPRALASGPQDSLPRIAPTWLNPTALNPAATAGRLPRLLASARRAAAQERALSRNRSASGADGLSASGHQRRRNTGARIRHRPGTHGSLSALWRR
jgi:hypothetical protein